MQTSLMILDLPSQGFPADIEKIAIKMPKGQGDLENGAYGGFADIINALMAAVPTDELQQTLDQLEWVPVEEGGVPGFAPLLDLTQEQAKAIGMAKRLLNEAAPETLRHTETLKSVLFPSLNPGVAEEKGGDPETRLKLPIQELAHQKGTEDLSGRKVEQVPSGIAEQIPAGRQKASHEAGITKPDPAALKPEPAALKSDADMAKPTATDGTPVKEVPPVQRQQSGGVEKEIRLEMPERRSAPMASVQQSGGQTMSEGQTGQQFSANHEQAAEQFDKHAAKSRSGDDAPAREFKPGIVDRAVETSNDSSDHLSRAGSENREAQAGLTARMKPAFGERMEAVSGFKEMPQTSSQEAQNNVIRQIVQRMTLQTQGAQSTMTIRLKPDFLGQVQMQISTDQQQVIVRMATESLAVKEMVEQGLQHLKTELQQHGLEIDKFDVFVANDNEDTKHSQDWAGFRQALKRRQREGMKQGREGTDDKETALSDEVEHRQDTNSAGEIDIIA